eukprot:TRINITY_DN107073_c0_g1_i1.p1 TRINITY_DN107073_c0_g1~~TRINITY_DN107073_c0_g1_i1.p1  ORF type:complete len:107 (+),score=12.43 TRINITY_DN107073_c0_g1_i1:73-393(+)
MIVLEAGFGAYLATSAAICFRALAGKPLPGIFAFTSKLGIRKGHVKVATVSSQGECSICYEELGSCVETQCGHQFHKECLESWLAIQSSAGNTSCPMCRSKLQSTS